MRGGEWGWETGLEGSAGARPHKELWAMGRNLNCKRSVMRGREKVLGRGKS